MSEVRRSKRLANHTVETPAVPEKKAKKTKKVIKKVDENVDENSPEKTNETTEEAEPQELTKGETKSNKKLQVGDTIPNVELRNEDDEVIHVHDLVKEKGAVFFMFPKADTPGCTKQACGFRDEYEKFTAAGYNVFALAQDSPKALLKWKTKKELPYKLLSDPNHALISPFGSSKPGKKVQRSHVIVGTGGAVVEIQGQVSPQDSVDKSVAFVTKA